MRSCLEGMGRGENSIQLQDKEAAKKKERTLKARLSVELIITKYFMEVYSISFCEMTRNNYRF